jgi:glucose-6-phosphate 1-dehydrogenase
MLDRFVLFGAEGDLAARLLLPALAELEGESLLPEGLAILGVGVEDSRTEEFRNRIAGALSEHAVGVAPEARAALTSRLFYRRGDAADPHDVRYAVGWAGRALVAYLALPPTLFPPALRALAAAELPPGSVVVIEKPFGSDLASAQELNGLIRTSFGTAKVFRNVHFLHSQTVQNLLGLRFGNRVLEPIWNAEHIERVDIVWDETLTLEGRAGYYDRAGALRDMLQNHLLQILCLTAMEPPASLEEPDVRNSRLAVLRAIPTPTPDDVARSTIRGRYTAGVIGGRHIPDYAREPGVDPGRGTETFAQITLQVANWRWAGVPFTLRSGKALGAAVAEVRVRFRDVPHGAFRGRGGVADTLQISLEPPVARFGLNVNAEGELFGLTSVTLEAVLPAPVRPAYAGLVLDILRGDPTLSVRGDEAEECWRVVQPILDGWSAGTVPLLPYRAGSSGPGGRLAR